MTKIENVTGTIRRDGLMHLNGSPYKTSESAESAARRAIADGYQRIVIQQVGAKRLQEGRSMDEDDHWVSAPGHEYFVWGDAETYEAKYKAVRAEIDARHAQKRESALTRYADALTAYRATPHTGFVMTGARFVEDLRRKGFGEVVNAATAAGKLEELRSVVTERNANR